MTRPAAEPQLVTLDVGPVAHGGHCVARLGERGGQVVFVRHALPGEQVRAVITERRKRYWRADAVEILRAAADRVTPPCPYAGPGRCGGCDFQHVSPDGQRALKTAVVREQLVRLGGLDAREVADLAVEALPGGPLGWRTRVQYAVDRQGRVGFRKHRSHDVVPVDRCLIAAPAIQEADVTSRRWRGASGVSVIAGGAEETVTVAAWRQSADRRSGSWRHVAGPAAVHERAVGRSWQLSPGAFWQVHPAAADTLATTVRDLLAPRPGEVAWDLYGGAGLIAAALAPHVGTGGSVTVVDDDPQATAAGRGGAGNLADLPQVSVVHGRVDEVIRQLPAPDVVVLDPPRTGAGAHVVADVVAAAPRAVAYVACDPAALARDVRTFREAGWRLATLRAFDAFPMTHHVECIALLEPCGEAA